MIPDTSIKYIDLRSDTVTRPVDEMRRLMAEAEVGDDVYGDDPTVNRLETLAAKILQKEAALFVPTGTMGNQLCIMTHTTRGDEIISGSNCHVVMHEVGAIAVLSGANVRTIEFADDIPDTAKIEAAIRDLNDIHYPRTGLITYENPTSSGRVAPLAAMRETYAVAKKHGIPVHIDGARLFNAAAALGVEAGELTQYCDSVMVCVSKGLCAPIGSVIAGTREFIARARKNRKLLGGGMRQAGHIAAPAIYALAEMTKRLSEDHANAKYLAKRLAEIPAVEVNPSEVEINMVFFRLNLPVEKLSALEKFMFSKGILINPPENGLLRYVTHYWVSKEHIDGAVASLIEFIG